MDGTATIIIMVTTITDMLTTHIIITPIILQRDIHLPIIHHGQDLVMFLNRRLEMDEGGKSQQVILHEQKLTEPNQTMDFTLVKPGGILIQLLAGDK